MRKSSSKIVEVVQRRDSGFGGEKRNLGSCGRDDDDEASVPENWEDCEKGKSEGIKPFLFK